MVNGTYNGVYCLFHCSFVFVSDHRQHIKLPWKFLSVVASFGEYEMA